MVIHRFHTRGFSGARPTPRRIAATTACAPR